MLYKEGFVKTIFEFAKDYIARGWVLFPLHSIDGDGNCTCGTAGCTDAGKHPRLARGLKDASKDPKQIAEWFGEAAPLSNIGLVTGQISGITVLDIDIGPTKKGDKTWADLINGHGEPMTLTAITGSGGLHVFFKYNSSLNTSSNTLGDGIDCRNDKGYVVAAPSRHRSGGSYRWEDIEAPLADLPPHLAKRKERRGRPKSGDPTKKKYTIEAAADMLKFIPANDRDIWRKVGIILGREFNRSDQAWEAYVEWSSSWGGKEGRNHDTIMREAFYEIAEDDGDLSFGTLVYLAIQGGWAPKAGQVPADNFVYFAPGNNYIYRPTGSFWPAESVEASCSPINEEGNIIKPSVWLRMRRLCTSMTNDPIIEEEMTKGWDCRDGALIEADGAALFNAYRPPNIKLGDHRLAGPFVDHVRKVFPKGNDADQFLDYMAHRVQKPGEKPRFALMIAGDQGVGKDTAIGMCYPAIGYWNVANIDPSAFDQNFNEFSSACLVVISEAANTHEMSKWAFNERSKVLIAGLPDYVTINPKYGQKYSVRLHCGVIVTTNHMLTGLYIPPDDRRYDVIEAATKAEMGLIEATERVAYFERLWGWYTREEGANHVAAFLHERDISLFSPSNGQRITDAHRAVVAAGLGGDDWLADGLELLGMPQVVRLDSLFSAVQQAAGEEIKAKEFSAKCVHGLTRAGYKKLNNVAEKDGRWRYKGESNAIKKVQVYFRPEDINLKDAITQAKCLQASF